jgi:6,7-dimethyl-8-ribityllumazine synthase
MNKSFAIVVGQFHKAYGETMVDEAQKVAAEYGLNVAEIVWVHGSLEKPLALKRLLMQPHIDGAIALGIIEKGETSHGLVMGHAVISAIIALEIDLMKPIGVGILGPDIQPSQIPSRVRPYAREAVIALAGMLGGKTLH